MFVLIRDGDYYKGKTYIHQGSYFAVISNGPADAKQYTSKKIAENAAKALNQKCEGPWVVYEVQQESLPKAEQ